MGRYSFDIDIDAPRDQVFDLFVNLDRMAEWAAGATRVTDIKGVADKAGTKYRLWHGVLVSDVEVIDAARPFYVRTRTKMGQIKAITNATFEARQDGSTRLRASLSSTGLLGSVWARIVSAGSWRGSLHHELSEFARLVEREASNRPS